MTRRDPDLKERWSLGDYIVTHDPVGWLMMLVALVAIVPKARKWLFKNKP